MTLLWRIRLKGRNDSAELVARRKSSVDDWILKQTANNWVPVLYQREQEPEIKP